MDKKRSIVKKPEKGSFMLDHNKECTKIKTKYLKCLKENKNDHICCRNYSKEYFICRMESNLLEKQNLENFGFFENELLNQKNRLHNFKDVFSYNEYNEKLENLSKSILNNKENDELISKSNLVNISKNYTDINNKNETKNYHFLLFSINDSKKEINPKLHEKIKKNEKITIKRKEVDGYLAGQEYLKTLSEKKKKKKSIFFKNIINNFLKNEIN